MARPSPLLRSFGSGDEADPGGPRASPECQTRGEHDTHLLGRNADLGDRTADLVALDEALDALARLDERKVQIIEMRFFGGLSIEETAEVLKVSPGTVRRDWSIAKLWLYRELGGGTRDESGPVEETR